MPTITAVDTQQHDPDRVNIHIDGRFAFGASRLLAVARNLVEGRELTEDEIEALQSDDAVERAVGAGLNFLSFRPRSRREVFDYFRRKKTDPEIAEAALLRLEHLGLLDDREFARFWVENRQAFRPRGTRALKAEMRQKGLESEVIDEALAGLGDEEDTAYEAGRKRAMSLRSADEREFYRVMTGFLQRRGFPYGVAAAAVRRLYRDRTAREAEFDVGEE